MDKLTVISSGSIGNAYILECENETLLIELGMPWKDIVKALNFDISKVKASIITHVHSDHANNDTIRKVIQYGIPVYSCEEVSHKYKGVQTIKKGVKAQIGGFKIQPIPLQHSVECFGFLIETPNKTRIVFATDCSEFLYKIKNVDVWMIEANYSDECIIDNMINDTVHQSLSENHLELEQTVTALKVNEANKARLVILIHLSKGNADPKMFKKRIQDELTLDSVYIAKKGLVVDLDEEF